MYSDTSRLSHACPRESRQKREEETRINRGETANNRAPLFRWPGFFSPRASGRRTGAMMMIGLKGTPERDEKIRGGEKNIMGGEVPGSRRPLQARACARAYRKYGEKKKTKEEKKK